MVVENFTPGVVDRLGIDYETVKGVNPKILYASISGFRADGALPEEAGLRPDDAGIRRDYELDRGAGR